MKKRLSSLLRSALNSILPVFLAFVIGGILIALLKENAFKTYGIMLNKTLFSTNGFLKTLHFASPLVLTGLAIAITFKANIFNMGVEGQLVLAGFTANIFAVWFADLPSFILIPLCLLVGIISGMIFALIPALLKAYYHVNEMVVTLMLNYAIVEILRFLAQGVFRDPKSGYVSTPIISNNAMFQKLGGGSITIFSIIVLIVFIIMIIVFRRSKLGYEINAIGKNVEFAEANGMTVYKKIITIMLISGALSGLAGAGYMLSEKYIYTLDFSGSPGLGWDGMLIALLGGHDPFGIIIAAIFYAALKTGADSIGIFTVVPKEIVAVIQGLIILFLAVKFINQNTTWQQRSSSIIKKSGALREKEAK